MNYPRNVIRQQDRRTYHNRAKATLRSLLARGGLLPIFLIALFPHARQSIPSFNRPDPVQLVEHF
jgi:hypothetical protein